MNRNKISETDKLTFDSLRIAIVNASLDGDANAMADLCSDDALLLHPNTSLISGKEELRDHEAKIFETVRLTKLILTPVEIYGMGNLAYEVGKQEVEIDQADERFLGKRKYVHILKKGIDGKCQLKSEVLYKQLLHAF